MVKWNNAIAIITGGGDGMGLEIALSLAATGCDLALVDLNPTKLEAAQAKCQAVHKDRIVSTHVCDVSNKTKTRDLVRAVSFHHKCANRTLLLFNNAGIGGGTSKSPLPKLILIVSWTLTGVASTTARAPFFRS